METAQIRSPLTPSKLSRRNLTKKMYQSKHSPSISFQGVSQIISHFLLFFVIFNRITPSDFTLHLGSLNSTPVTLKYFYPFVFFLSLKAPPSPVCLLIPATLHLYNLARSKLCYFYTRAGEQSVRVGEWRWRWCRFPGFFRAPSSNLAHLPPSALF